MRPAKAALLVVAVLVGNLVGPPSGEQAGICAVGVPVAQAISPEAEARNHARKANHLADINKCKLAIPEYNKALRLLREPTLLFNRAECHRRTGDAAKAVADYRKFLDQMPSAPNRAQVEAQIAALDRSAAPAGKSSAARPAATAKVSSPPPPPPLPLSPPAPSAPALPPPGPPVVSGERRNVDRSSVAERRAAEPDDLGRVARAPSLAEREVAPMALVDSPASRPQPAAEAESGSSHWWAWVLGAVVIVGGAAGTYFALQQGKTDIPSSALGNYKF
jgi:hypothetical protein